MSGKITFASQQPGWGGVILEDASRRPSIVNTLLGGSLNFRWDTAPVTIKVGTLWTAPRGQPGRSKAIVVETVNGEVPFLLSSKKSFSFENVRAQLISDSGKIEEIIEGITTMWMCRAQPTIFPYGVDNDWVAEQQRALTFQPPMAVLMQQNDASYSFLVDGRLDDDGPWLVPDVVLTRAPKMKGITISELSCASEEHIVALGSDKAFMLVNNKGAIEIDKTKFTEAMKKGGGDHLREAFGYPAGGAVQGVARWVGLKPKLKKE